MQLVVPTKASFYDGPMQKTFALLFSLSMYLGLPFLAQAEAAKVCVDGDEICFATSTTIGDKSVPMRGKSLFRYWGFKVYGAAFYEDPSLPSSPARISSGAKQLVIHYRHEFTPEDFQKSGRAVIEDTPFIKNEEVLRGLKAIDALYKSVELDDRYSITYVPNKGLELALNGTLLGTIPGEEFQKAYFSIWLGEAPVKESFRDELLGQE